MRLFLFLLCGFLLSCGDKKKKNFVTIKKNNVIIEGDITNDTIYNDTIHYYDFDHNLIRKDYFKNGKQEGVSIDYFPNGKPKMITSYRDGLKNGYNSYFDSLGKCYYKDYYFHNLTVGPVIFFNEKEYPKSYFFANLQNETLFYINYLEWHGIKDVVSKCINFTMNVQRRDSTREISILLYLINPPKFIFDYSIFKMKKESETDFIKVFDIKSDLPFIKIDLPLLPKNEHYVIGLNIVDSLINKKTVIYKDIESSAP